MTAPGYDGAVPAADDLTPAARDQLQRIFEAGVRDGEADGPASPAEARAAARRMKATAKPF